MGSAVVWRAESAVVPVLILDDVREGLLCVLGEAAEEIVEVLTQPYYEQHPEWFSGSRVLLGEAWACLDEIGWVGGKYPRPAKVSVSEHGEIMARGIAAFLPCLDDFLREAPVNDHDRIARGLPRSSRACPSGYRPWRSYRSCYRRRTRTMRVMRLDRGASWLEPVVRLGARPCPPGRKRSEHVKQGWKVASSALNCPTGRLACACIRYCRITIASSHYRSWPPAPGQRPDDYSTLGLLQGQRLHGWNGSSRQAFLSPWCCRCAGWDNTRTRTKSESARARRRTPSGARHDCTAIHALPFVVVLSSETACLLAPMKSPIARN